VIYSKIASWQSALVYFLAFSRAFAHLVIFLVDFPLFVLTVFFYRRARMVINAASVSQEASSF